MSTKVDGFKQFEWFMAFVLFGATAVVCILKGVQEKDVVLVLIALFTGFLSCAYFKWFIKGE